MINSQLFDLEKIKKFTLPIEELQIKLNELTQTSNYVMENIQTIERQFKDQNFLFQIETVEKLFKNINIQLNKISRTNLKKFLDLQDRLIRKYKENFKDKLKTLNLNEELTKLIGLSLIEDKKISKIIDFVSFIPSIEIPEWLDLLDSLKNNTIFLKSVKKIRNYYQELLKARLELELRKVPEDTDPILIKDYKNYFEKTPTLTFNTFMEKIESQLTQQEISVKKGVIKKVREKEELEKLKKKQEEQKETYENYLKHSDS